MIILRGGNALSECTMHVGIPQSVSSLWQQMGRGGRGFQTNSVAVVIGLPNDPVYRLKLTPEDWFFLIRLFF